MVVFTFSVFFLKKTLLGKFGLKLRIAGLSWNLVTRLIWICRCNNWRSILSFSTETHFFWEIWSKKSEVSVWGRSWYLDLFEYADINADVQFFSLLPEISFLGQEMKIFSLSWNSVPRVIRICKKSKEVFTFSDLDEKYSFLENFVQKLKIFTLSSIKTKSNLVNFIVKFAISVFNRKYPF